MERDMEMTNIQTLGFFTQQISKDVMDAGLYGLADMSRSQSLSRVFFFFFIRCAGGVRGFLESSCLST